MNKRKKIVILNSCFVSERKDQIQTTSPTLRLGIASLCSYLRQYGHEVTLIDPQSEKLTIEDLVNRIIPLDPDYVCLGAYTEEINDADLIAQRIKAQKRNVTVIIGGYHVSALPLETFNQFSCFDIGIIGEGEEKLRKVVSGHPLHEIDGVVTRDKSGQPVFNLGNEARVDLDGLPVPAWDLYKLERYDKRLPIEPLRGCPFNCIFCFRAIGRQVTYKSPSRFMEELNYLFNTYGTDKFRFLAGTFPLKRSHAVSICSEIVKSKLNIDWEASARVDLLDQEILILMKKSGCSHLQLGIESGSQKILDLVNKGTKLEAAFECVKFCKQIGIKAGLNFIIGHPYETQETIDETYKFALKLRRYAHSANFAILVPFPGTTVFEMAQKGEGSLRLASQNWYDFGKQAGLALKHDGFPGQKLQKYQSTFYFKYYLGSPMSCLRLYSHQRLLFLLKRFF